MFTCVYPYKSLRYTCSFMYIVTKKITWINIVKIMKTVSLQWGYVPYRPPSLKQATALYVHFGAGSSLTACANLLHDIMMWRDVHRTRSAFLGMDLVGARTEFCGAYPISPCIALQEIRTWCHSSHWLWCAPSPMGILNLHCIKKEWDKVARMPISTIK